MCCFFSVRRGQLYLKSVTPLEIGRYIIYLGHILRVVFVFPCIVENGSCVRQLKASVPFELPVKSNYLSLNGLVFRS